MNQRKMIRTERLGMEEVPWWGPKLFRFTGWIIGCYSVYLTGYILIQVFLCASFSIPSDSMEPTLQPGDYVLINKPLKGARLFNIWDALNHRPLTIRRLKGHEYFRRGEVLVFNFPYPGRWDSIGFDIKLYYVKRCIALPGDTVEIHNAHYRIRGVTDRIGCVEMQDGLAAILSEERGRKEFINRRCYDTYPYDPTLRWNIREFGPLYVPAAGDIISMDSIHFRLYKNLIEWEQSTRLSYSDGQCYLNGKTLVRYRFKENYYFMAGDNCYNSQDSRYWGLLPESYIAGKAVRIWQSKNRFTGDMNWDRVWKRIE